jgi:hypothetical protein
VAFIDRIPLCAPANRALRLTMPCANAQRIGICASFTTHHAQEHSTVSRPFDLIHATISRLAMCAYATCKLTRCGLARPVAHPLGNHAPTRAPACPRRMAKNLIAAISLDSGNNVARVTVCMRQLEGHALGPNPPCRLLEIGGGL